MTARMDDLRRDLEEQRDRDFRGGLPTGEPIPCKPDVLDDIGRMSVIRVLRILTKHQIDAIRRVGELEELMERK